MTPVQLKTRITKGIATEQDVDKLELILRWLETPTGDPAKQRLVRNVLISEMEHLEGKGMTVDEARTKALKALRR